MHRVTSTVLFIDTHSSAPATSETIQKCRIVCVENIFVQSFSFTIR